LKTIDDVIKEMATGREKLYMFDCSSIALQDIFLSAGRIEVWYKESREQLVEGSGFREVAWFLTEKKVVRVEIDPSSINATTHNRGEIVRIDRRYKNVPGLNADAVLVSALIRIKGEDTYEIKYPQHGSPTQLENFRKLVALLG